MHQRHRNLSFAHPCTNAPADALQQRLPIVRELGTVVSRRALFKTDELPLDERGEMVGAQIGPIQFSCFPDQHQGGEFMRTQHLLSPRVKVAFCWLYVRESPRRVGKWGDSSNGQIRVSERGMTRGALYLNKTQLQNYLQCQSQLTLITYQ